MNLFQENSVFKDSPFGEHWDKPIDQWAIPEFGYAKILNKRNLIIADKSDKIPHGQADGYSAVINNDGPKYTFKVYSHPDGEKVLQMYNEFKIDEKQPYEVTVFIETNDGKFDFGKIVRVKFGPAVIEDLKYKYLSELPWKDNDPEDIAEKFIKAAWVNSVSQQTKDKVDNERKGADFEDLLVKAIQYEYDNKKFDDFSWFILMIKGTEYVGFKLSDWCFSSAKWLRERKYLEDKYWNGDLPEKEFTPAFLPDSIFYENKEDREKALKEYFREPFIKLRRYVGEKIDGDGSFEKKLALELYSKINDLQEVSDVLVENFLSEIAIPDDFYIESYIKHVHAFEVGLYNGIVEFVAGICDLTAIVVLVCRQELGFRMTDALTEKFENFVNDLYYKTIETLKKIWQAIINLFKDFEKWYEQFSEYDGKSYKILKELGELIPDILTFVIPVLKGSKAAKIAKAGEEVAEIAEKKAAKEVGEAATKELSEVEAQKIAKSAKEGIENGAAKVASDEASEKIQNEITEKTVIPLEEVLIKQDKKAPKRKAIRPKAEVSKVFKKTKDMSKVLSDYADDALILYPEAEFRPGAVAILEGKINGRIYQLVEYSGSRGLKANELSKKYHPLVKEWIESVPKNVRFKGTRGKCGENFTISEWLYEVERLKGIKQGKITIEQARKEFEGVVSKAMRIQNKDADNLLQGIDKPACGYCNPMLEHFNIQEF